MENKKVVLIGFHNEKALGVRYLANALSGAGFTPYIIFFKGFNSVTPQCAAPEELELLSQLLKGIDPVMVGLSAMSSLYFETIIRVNQCVKESLACPVLWGGVLATLEPQIAAKYGDYVVRGEGEEIIVEIAQRLSRGQGIKDLQNLSYLKGSELVQNPLASLEQNLDKYGYPIIGGQNMYLIQSGKVQKGDPQLKAFTYELSASRGCPFTCTYCSSINLHRLYSGKGSYVRFRSVDSVLEELVEAKKMMPRLRVVHFWDEIFSDETGWIEEFSARYPKEIGLPFRIWGHPLRVDEHIISCLVSAGLYQVVMGIQSGSPRVRKDVFKRFEGQQDIINTAAILAKCGVPHVVYDFMLCHPFEREQDLKETFELCLQLTPRFDLNIHGLNFLPATDIVEQAIKQGIYTKEQLSAMMYSGLREQYDRYWGPSATAFSGGRGQNVWVDLIYLTQFSRLHPRLLKLSQNTGDPTVGKTVAALRRRMEGANKIRQFARKVELALGW